MTWQQFEEELHTLSQKIKTSPPDIIIGIIRGGVIPARLLATYLEIKHMYCLTVEKQENERKVTTDITTDLKDKRILLVEDMLETGKSLIAAKEYLESKGAFVQTACLYIMPISKIEPNYYLRTIENVETFPWEN